MTIYDLLYKNEAQISFTMNSKPVNVSINTIKANASQVSTYKKVSALTPNVKYMYQNFIGTDNTKFDVVKKSENGFRYLVKSSVDWSETQYFFRRYEFIDTFSMIEYKVPNRDCKVKAIS